VKELARSAASEAQKKETIASPSVLGREADGFFFLNVQGAAVPASEIKPKL